MNPRHADWLEANLAKCRRAAPPPGPPPPIPRSLLLEKQQEQAHQQQQHQATDGIYLAFSSPNPAPTVPFFQAAQPTQAQQTLICYRSFSLAPEVSNEIETVAIRQPASDTVYQAHQQPQNLQLQPQQNQQIQPQPHVRRRKTPPCSMYSSNEPDLVEVDTKLEPQSPTSQHYYSAYTNRKRLALTARQRHIQSWSQSGGHRRHEENPYSYHKSWKGDANGQV